MGTQGILDVQSNPEQQQKNVEGINISESKLYYRITVT